VKDEQKKSNTIERFVEFRAIGDHDAATLQNAALETLSKPEPSISNICGQMYNNTSNMSEIN
jgi:hypothetical protein